jgi:DNA polymerase I-like protein with 3'-5' exonuclease and polymerase domains
MLVKGYKISIWKGQVMGPEITVDCETTVEAFHTRLHKLVLFQAFDGVSAFIVNKEDVRSFLLTNYHATLIGQNIKFDMGVIANEIGWSLLYKFYDRNKVRDTKLMYQLWSLGYEGVVPRRGTSLAGMMQRFFNIFVDKDEAVRCTFGEYLDKPVSDIPDAHIEYAMLDVIYTHKLYKKLLGLITAIDTHGTLLSLDIQMKGDLALGEIYKNGIGVDLEATQNIKTKLGDRLGIVEQRMALWGYIKGRPGVLDIYENILEHIGIADQLPRSPKSNRISSKEDDLIAFSNYPFISDYMEYSKLSKLLSFTNALTEKVIHPSYTTIQNTGRTASSNPNIQNVPRSGGIRECFVPTSKEKEFYIIDYSGMESAMLAQVLYDKYGHSSMLDAINRGEDLHRYYASVLFNKEQKDVTKEERQQAKAAVFGFPGGLGIDTFIQFAAGYGLNLKRWEAEVMKEKYFDAFPEMVDYLKECEEGDVFTRTGRRRANATYCAVANTPFQGLGSDMLKTALYGLIRAGFKVVAEIHDEAIIEIDKNTDRYKEACDIMIQAGKVIAPDVIIDVDGHRLDRWEKL